MYRREIVWGGLGLLLGFLLGFGWQYVRASGLASDLDETRRELAFESLEAELASATVEAQRGGYEIARQRASDFFTGLQAQAHRAPEAARDELRGILRQRDALITSLSRNDPQAGDLLARVLVRYRVALKGAEAGMPLSTSPAAPVPEGEQAPPAAQDSPPRAPR